MVGLVIVSHSRALGEALKALVQQVVIGDIPIAVAAGVGPDREEFGTDAVEISEAIQSVYSEEGVLVLMDLGSAILSAEMALELLSEEMKSKVRFCAAPIVEGAIAAGVQIGLNSGLDAVCQEALDALQAKIEHLIGAEAPQVEEPAAPPSSAPAGLQEAAEPVVLTLRNQHGLHARPAARFVQTAASFDADVRVKNLTSGKGPVSARSLNALATLGAVHGDQVQVTASGPQSDEALLALARLVEANFGEAEAQPAAPEPSRQRPSPPAVEVEGAVQAVPVSEGVALGPFHRYEPPAPAIPDEPTKNPDEDWRRLESALEKVRKAIQKRRQDLISTIGEEQTAIFDAHLLILQDPDLLEAVRAAVFEEKQNAAAAWHHGIQKVAQDYRALPDPYLQQRAIDVLDVGNQVLFALNEKAQPAFVELKQPVVLFATELTPTETSQLDLTRVLGLATVGGGPTSHSAILARAMGIPAVAGLDPAYETIKDGTPVGLDGFSGMLWIDPEPARVEELQQSRETWLKRRDELLQTSHQPAVTRDGKRIEIAANVGSLLDAQMADKNGAEAIGLLRTEFLFLTGETPPGEEDQVAALREIGETMGYRPVIVRTLDVGGDKPLPYIEMPEEPNPFLGVRAIRLSLRHPELFLTQLRAILRAGAEHNFRIMFPMIAELAEVRQARQLLQQAHEELESQGTAHRWPVETGIMVEIPSAALLSPVLAPEVDFFSIGTNDLTQYTLAAERGNPSLSHLSDGLHPSVLKLIQSVASAAHQNGKWTGVCGELAGDPLAAPLLIGLGVDELSMNPSAVPRIKSIVRRLSLGGLANLVEQALQLDSAVPVRSLSQSFLDSLPES